MDRDLLPVVDQRPQHVWRDQRVGEIDRTGRHRTEQECDEPPRPVIGTQHVPAPVDHEGRIGLLLRQHEVERRIDLRKLRRAEHAFAPHRRETRRKQQRILLAQRHVEHRRKAQHHVAARLRARGFEEAQMPLRDLGSAGEIELRQGAMLAPPLQARGEPSP